MKPLSILAVTTALAAGATSARADDAPIPDTATCDRLGLASSFSADFSATFWDEIFGAELFGVGLTLRAQYMAEIGLGDTSSMAGGYATVPLGWGKVESPLIVPDGEESDFGVGNIELGGAASVPAGGGAVLARLGVALPTAEDDDNNAGPVLSSPARITDIVLYPDETTTIRISGSYLQSFGQVFVRVDAGLDLPFSDEEDMSAFNDEDPLVRLNAAAGFRLDPVALMGELVTVGTTGDVANDEDRFFHTFAFTARFVGGDVQPMASVVVPLDDGVNDLVDLTVIAGVTASLPVN